MDKEKLGYTIIFTFILTFILVFGLSSLYRAVAPLEEANRKNRGFIAVLDVLSVSYDSVNRQSVAQKYRDILTSDEPIQEMETISFNGEEIILSPFSGKGLWGQITGLIAVDKQVKKIIGLRILSQEETPGLGGRISEPWFQEQFTDEVIPEGPFRVVPSNSKGGDQDHSNGAIDAITGASLTSKAIEVIINDELNRIKESEGLS